MSDALLRFHDENGVEWWVREIADPTLSVMPARLLPHPEYATGWLLFESLEDKRRLAPYPPNWRELALDDLLAHFRRARPASPSRQRPSPSDASASS